MTKLKIIALIAVIVVTAVALAPSLNNGFTNWDDPDFITENPDIKSISFKKIGKFFTTSYGGFAGYVPFILLTYTVEYSLFGLNAQAYHTTNLVLHLINCVLVFWFIFLISQKLPVAFIVSLLFGIHPLHVEPVAWIQGRKDLLFSLFYLAALILYVKYLKKGRKKSFYFFALLFFILSLFSKVAAISLPFSLLLLDFFISKKIDKQSIQNKIPFFLFSLLFVFLAFLTFDTGAFAIQASDIDYVNNILLFFYSFIFYINKILLPFQLSARYSMDISQLPLNLLAGVGIFFVIIFLLYRFYRSERYRHDVTFGILFFLITLMPTIPFHFVRQPYADRYTYIPLTGFFYLLGLFLYHLYYERFRDSKKIKVFLLIAFTGCVLILAAASRTKCYAWKDSLTLWNDVLKTNPKHSVAYLNRGEIFLKRGEPEKALQDLNKAVEFNRNNAPAYLNRGIYYFGKKGYERALEEYNTALRINPGYFNAYLNRGNLWGRLGYFHKAVSDYDLALKIDSHSVPVYFLRGMTYGKMDKFDKAINDFTKILEINPSDVSAYFNRGKMYARQGKTRRAVQDFEKAIEINPKYLPPYHELQKIRD